MIETPAQPSTVIVQKDHNHAPSCGHYLNNGVWYAEPEHIHVVKGN